MLSLCDYVVSCFWQFENAEHPFRISCCILTLSATSLFLSLQPVFTPQLSRTLCSNLVVSLAPPWSDAIITFLESTWALKLSWPLALHVEKNSALSGPGSSDLSCSSCFSSPRSYFRIPFFHLGTLKALNFYQSSLYLRKRTSTLDQPTEVAPNSYQKIYNIFPSLQTVPSMTL